MDSWNITLTTIDNKIVQNHLIINKQITISNIRHKNKNIVNIYNESKNIIERFMTIKYITQIFKAEKIICYLMIDSYNITLYLYTKVSSAYDVIKNH